MARNNLLLVVDGIVNLVLGVLLVFFPTQLMDAFDLPKAETFFYVNILGAVLFGIGMALLLECFAGKRGVTGLGIGGAIPINLFAVGVLIFWLVSGGLELSQSGAIFLWGITIIVLGIAVAELVTKSWKSER